MQPNILKRKLLQYRNSFNRFILLGIGAVILVLVVNSTKTLIRLSTATGLTPTVVWHVLFDSRAPVKQFQGKTNILLLGMAGGQHEGADLADTIIVATIDYQRKKLFFTSLPRDIWVPSLQDKINTSYHYGIEKGGTKEDGLILAKSIAEEVTGLPIHYVGKIEFSEFKEIVDVLGGVEVEVPEAFIDAKYPIAGKENELCNGDPEYKCRYMTVTFEKGLQHMDGERALIYVRSRGAAGDQGSDIARGLRQQQILFAVRKTLMNPQSVFAFERNKKLWQVLIDATDTDMNLGEILAIGKASIFIKREAIETIQLSIENFESTQAGILVNPPLWQYGGRWVLVPKANDFNLLHRYIQCKIEEKEKCEDLIPSI